MCEMILLLTQMMMLKHVSNIEFFLARANRKFYPKSLNCHEINSYGTRVAIVILILMILIKLTKIETRVGVSRKTIAQPEEGDAFEVDFGREVYYYTLTRNKWVFFLVHRLTQMFTDFFNDVWFEYKHEISVLICGKTRACRKTTSWRRGTVYHLVEIECPCCGPTCDCIVYALD